MQITTTDTRDGKVISVQVDERLDFSVCRAFIQASRLSQAREMRKIEIDLGRTQSVFSSGLAMLLMLRQQAGRLRNQIMLVNCSPKIRNQLASSQLDPSFNIR